MSSSSGGDGRPRSRKLGKNKIQTAISKIHGSDPVWAVMQKRESKNTNPKDTS